MIVDKTLLLPSYTVKRNSPVNLVKGDEIYFKHEYEKTFPDVYLWQLKNVNVTSEGIVFSKGQIYKFGNHICEYNNIFKKSKYLLSKYLLYKKINLNTDETYLLAFDSWSNGYFHWMCDVLPKLTALRNRLRNMILLLPENFTHPFIKETLKVFSFKDIFIIPSGKYVFVPNLATMDNIAPTGNYNPEIMKKLRGIFLSHYNDIDIPTKDKIYVSREKAKYKFVVNENEVVRNLDSYGFKTIYFEQLTLRQQIQISSHTKILIGVHGSNLVNMLFMKPETFVLELRKQKDGVNNAYYSLAESLGIKYLYQFCPMEGRIYKHFNMFDIRVDITTLNKNIGLISL